MAYTCQNCGVSSEVSSKLCAPAGEIERDNLCGVPADKICSGKMAEMKYSCDSCGSVSATADNLCDPSTLK